jgi:malate dehydrogenase (oxaloacetate-decarboxylating)(NADP+)
MYWDFPTFLEVHLDVRATEINEEMKLAAVRAIADLAKEPVPDIVFQAYGIDLIQFGREYLIPKPLDPRLITTISPAVAKAAMDSGIAKNPITDWGKYHEDLLKRVGIDQKLTSRIIDVAKTKPKQIVFAEADHPKILKAAQILQDQKIAFPILLGSRVEIEKLIHEHGLDLSECKIIDPREEKERTEKFAAAYHKKRERKGVTLKDAHRQMRDRNAFGAMMVEFGEADALVSGLTKDYPKTILPSLQIIGMAEGVNRVAGMYIILNKKGTFFFADCTVNVDPNAEELVDIIGLAARGVKGF